MNLTFLQFIILFCLQKLNGERTIYSIYHLLHGKKSSQTIQDAHLYHLTTFYQTFPILSREYLENTVNILMKQQLITPLADQQFFLTEKGEQLLLDQLEGTPIPIHLDGWKYQRKAVVLWERLSLTIQVISYLQKRESKFMPIQRKSETHIWLKDFLRKNTLNREELGSKLFSELVDILDREPTINPDLFVIRLSGYKTIGYTANQAAEKVGMEATYYHFQFLNILHYLILMVEANSNEYSLLASILLQSQNNNLTFSTEKTYTLLKKGHSISDIIIIRQLKKSTIEDHLVELALNMKDFSIDEYVTKEKQNQIKKVVRERNTKKLKEIRNIVDDASYFEIRLVLAKHGET